MKALGLLLLGWVIGVLGCIASMLVFEMWDAVKMKGAWMKTYLHHCSRCRKDSRYTSKREDSVCWVCRWHEGQGPEKEGEKNGDTGGESEGA